MAGISSSFSRDLVNWTPKEYAYITLSVNQVAGVAITNPVRFDTMVGNMTFDPTTYRITLKANKTYRLKASIVGVYSGINGYSYFELHSVTAGGRVGTIAHVRSVTTAAADKSNYSDVFLIVTPAVDTVIDIRLNAVSLLTTIYRDYSHWEIQEIDTFAPSRAKWQHEYVSPLLDLTCGGPAGWVTTRAVGVFYKTSNGAWKLNFNIVGAAGINTDFSVTVTGVTFKNVANNYQAISVGSVGGFITYNYATPNSSVVRCTYNANVTSIRVSGDVELDAKPTGYDIPSDV